MFLCEINLCASTTQLFYMYEDQNSENKAGNVIHVMAFFYAFSCIMWKALNSISICLQQYTCGRTTAFNLIVSMTLFYVACQPFLFSIHFNFRKLYKTFKFRLISFCNKLLIVVTLPVLLHWLFPGWPIPSVCTVLWRKYCLFRVLHPQNKDPYKILWYDKIQP